MKKIEWFWNIVYYNVYIFDSKCRKLFNYLNPFYLINKIPAVKKHHSKHGVDDMNKFAERILNNPKSGISSIWSGSFMGGLLVFIGISLLNIIETIIGRSLIRDVTNSSSHFIIFFVILLGPTMLINNCLLFKKDKYLNYFKEFEMMSKEKKSVYGWLSFFVIVLIFSFFIGSFLVF
jgi:hypothetical protein